MTTAEAGHAARKILPLPMASQDIKKASACFQLQQPNLQLLGMIMLPFKLNLAANEQHFTETALKA